MILAERLRQFLVDSLPEVAGRVHPLVLPEGAALPALTYQQVSEPPEHLLKGDRSTLRHPRFQVTVWSRTYGEAVALAGAVGAALRRYGGTLVERQPDRYEPLSASYMVPVDVIIWHWVTGDL